MNICSLVFIIKNSKNPNVCRNVSFDWNIKHLFKKIALHTSHTHTNTRIGTFRTIKQDIQPSLTYHENDSEFLTLSLFHSFIAHTYCLHYYLLHKKRSSIKQNWYAQNNGWCATSPDLLYNQITNCCLWKFYLKNEWHHNFICTVCLLLFPYNFGYNNLVRLLQFFSDWYNHSKQ